MPGAVTLDAYGHETEQVPSPTQLTAGAVSTTAAGTISPTTSAGASPTVTVTEADDRAGNFLLNPVTGGGAQAAGTVAKVRFLREYPSPPRAVLLTGFFNETDGNLHVVAGVTLITSAGFDIATGAVLVTAKAYRATYLVIP